MKIQYLSFLFLFFTFSFFHLKGQDIIELSNPSYEDFYGHSQVANEWDACVFNGQSPPDIQPGAFHIDKEAYDGNTYCGMVTRDDGSFEVLTKQLDKSLKKGTCYEWVIYMAQSPHYESISRTTLQVASFTNPVNVVIYGAKSNSCEKMEALAVAKNIHQQEDWLRYKFIFHAEKNYDYILISVESVQHDSPTNGHILVDYFHPITPIDCLSEKVNVSIPKEKELLENLSSIHDFSDKIGWETLGSNLYLPYQYYYNEEDVLSYDHLYLNHNLEKIISNNWTLQIMSPKTDNAFLNYVKKYIAKKQLSIHVEYLVHNNKSEKKVEESINLYQGQRFHVYIQK